MSRKTIVVALGGNAIIEEGTKGTIEEQFENTRKSLGAIVGMIQEGHKVVLTHGNGPQAGVHLIRNEAASTQVPLLRSTSSSPTPRAPWATCSPSVSETPSSRRASKRES